MPAVKFSPFGNSQTVNATGAPANGWKIYTYQAGSSTPLAAYTDSTGNVAQSNPIIINSLGFPTNGQIWLQAGIAYKLVLTDASDVVQKTEDNISGINDTASSVSEWVTGPTPTYINATTFTVAGDQRQAFQVGRRLRFSVTAGTVYGTIASSVYNGSSLTTITIGGGEGPLDSGLSSVAYGFMAAQNPSLPSEPIAGSSVKRLVALNNTGTPNTKMDMSAIAVTFVHPATGGTYTKLNQAVLTNDIGVAGPAANGRDQVGAFGTTAEVHFYFIWNGSAVATVSSLSPPPTGPTLPTGYTHWAYALSVRLNGTNLPQVRAFGRRVSYVTAQSMGTPNTSTSFTYSTFVPAIAECFSWTGAFSINADGSGNAYASLGVDSGITNQRVIEIGMSGLGAGGATGPFYARWTDMPNMPAQIFSIVVTISASGGGATTAQLVTDYVVPNC